MMEGNDRRLRNGEPGASAASGQSGISPALIGFVVVAVVAVIFVLQNREKTQIDFLFFEVNARVWTSLAVAVALGVILDRLFSAWWRRRKRRNDAR